MDGDTYEPEYGLDDSLDCPHSRREPDDDFNYMGSLFQLSDYEWELGLNQDNIKIYRKRQTVGSLFMVKCLINLPNIPKEVAFKVLSDLNIRKKWDDILSTMTIVEEDEVIH